MTRLLISSRSPMESVIGFSRAVRSGRNVSVAGTAPIGPDGRTLCPGDVYGQTKACLAIARKALEEAGADIQDVTRTRVLLTDVRSWKEAARAHGEVFGQVRPACTFFGVSGFIDPEWLVEIEIDCLCDDRNSVPED